MTSSLLLGLLLSVSTEFSLMRPEEKLLMMCEEHIIEYKCPQKIEEPVDPYYNLKESEMAEIIVIDNLYPTRELEVIIYPYTNYVEDDDDDYPNYDDDDD